MQLWNPDEPSTPRGPAAPLPGLLEARLREACEELEITWDGCAARAELAALCERLGLEVGLQSVSGANPSLLVSEVFYRLNFLSSAETF